MAVTSTKPYAGASRDALAHFEGRQLVYVCWEQHLLFAAPFLLCVTPQTGFGEFVRDMLTPLMAADPDCARIDWQQARWRKSGVAFTPDLKRSFADNGIGHKEQLILSTPGLNTVCGGA